MNAWLERLTGVMLVDSWVLGLALLVPLAIWVRIRRGAPAIVFTPASLATDLPGSLRAAALPLPRLLQIGGVLLLVVALARPAVRTPLARRTQGIDILLCMDVSSSMTADDMDTRRSRLEVAKSAAARFVAQRRDDRIGLVTFARYPELRCPLTLDHAALTTLLEDIETVSSDSPEDATGIGTAVARAAQVLGGSGSPSRLLILLTDGEENVATADKPQEIAPVHAAQLCRQLGVRVYTVAAGVGTDGESAAPGAPPVDTRQVELLSERTDGRFFGARDAAALTTVYDAIDRLETAELEEARYEVKDRFLPVIGLGLLLLLSARILESTVLRVIP